MSNFSLVFSPELQIDPQDFANFWNNNPQLRAQAVAQVQTAQTAATYDISTWAAAALVFFGAMLGDVIKDVIVDYIKEYLQQKLKKEGKIHSPEFELIETKTSGGESLWIVVAKQQD